MTTKGILRASLVNGGMQPASGVSKRVVMPDPNAVRVHSMANPRKTCRKYRCHVGCGAKSGIPEARTLAVLRAVSAPLREDRAGLLARSGGDPTFLMEG